MSEYEVNEEDLEGSGTSDVHPIGDYEIVVAEAEGKTDKNGAPYLAFQGIVVKGKNKGIYLFENYLPFKKKTYTKGKHAGKTMLDFRTKSFLASIGHKSGIPAGAPGGPDASTLNGTLLKVRNEHVYNDVPDHEYPVRTGKGKYNAEYLEALENGDLEGITPENNLGFYSMSDDFEGIGANVDQIPAKKSGGPKASTPQNAPADDSGADEEDWG